MKIAFFYYDDFAEFEIALAGLLLCQKAEIISVALEQRVYRCEEGQRFVVDQTLAEVDMDSLDLLVIPGGNPMPLVGNPVLKAFIREMVARGKKVAGICGGTGIMAASGVLNGKTITGDTSGIDPETEEGKLYGDSTISDAYVVVDGNLITAQGQAYAEFAVELADQMGLFDSPAEKEGNLRWVKNIRAKRG